MSKVKQNRARKPIGIKEWMQYRPYEKVTNYDRDYLDFTRDLMEETLIPLAKSKFINLFESPTQFERTAIIVSSYVEDVKSGIGLWKAFTDKNRGLYGLPVPFIEVVKYEEGKANLADLRYLLWWYFYHEVNITIDPNSDLILGLASSMLVFIQEEWDTLPDTDFYQTYWKLEDKEDFHAVYDRLYWLGLNSYMSGVEAQTFLAQGIDEVLESSPGMAENPKALLKLTVDLQQDYLFRNRLSFSALSPREWMEAIVKPGEDLKAALADTHQVAEGFFECVGETETHFQFTYLSEKMDLDLAKASFNAYAPQVGEKWMLKMVRWDGEWWSIAPSEKLSPEEEQHAAQNNFQAGTKPYYLNSAELRADWEARMKAIEDSFQFHFEGLIKRYETTEEAKTAYEAFLQTPIKYQDQDVLYNDLIKGTSFESKNQNIVGPLLFFIPGSGISSMNGLQEIEKAMEEIQPDEIMRWREVFGTLFFNPFPSEIIRDLLKKYPNAPWLLPVPKAETRVDQWSEAFLRFFHPNTFSRD